MRHPIVAATLLCIAQPAIASPPQAWAELERQAERSCSAASGLRQPRISKVIVFDDTVGVGALLVTGTQRVRGQRTVKSTNLCLYDRRSRRAAVEEAAGWSERR